MAHTYKISAHKPSRKKIVLSGFDQKTLEKAEKKTLEELSSQIKMKGFRAGKIPEAIIRSEVEPSYIRSRTLEHALPLALQEIMTEEKHRVLGKPKIDFTSLDPISIDIEYDVYPEVKVGDYKKIHISMKKQEITDKELKEAIEGIKRRFTEYKAVDRVAKIGDRVEIDFEGFSPEGVSLEKTRSTHYPVLIGSGMLIPGFEENLVGTRKSDEKSFTLKFPKEYHVKSLSEKEVLFKVKVHQVEEAIIPEITDAWLEKVMGKKMTVTLFEEDLKKRIAEDHLQNAKREREDSYCKELLKIIRTEVPETLVTFEKNAMLKEIQEQISKTGMSFDQYLKAVKKSEEELIKSFEKPAEERIRLRLGLQDIAIQEKVDFTKILEKLLESV